MVKIPEAGLRVDHPQTCHCNSLIYLSPEFIVAHSHAHFIMYTWLKVACRNTVLILGSGLPSVG